MPETRVEPLADPVPEALTPPPEMDTTNALGPDDRARLAESSSLQPTTPPTQIGPYRILEVLGEGGMGSVYKAEQRQPIRRVVAMKVIKLGFDTKDVIARFESERQALARMDHPNVAKVLDAGTTDTGQPFFVMEYVPGKPLTRFCDDMRLTIPQRLELFGQVCGAIAHAHTKAILHRDVKASNVLAYLADGKPTVKVIDFGVAKALAGDRLTDLTYNTGRGIVVGTIETMSPEQAQCSPDIDIRTDVYSLGVLLYELLVGVKPYDITYFRSVSYEEARAIICESEIPLPGDRLRALGSAGPKIAQLRQLTVSQLTRELRRELQSIPLKAIAKNREDRYANVPQLAEDVERYLNDRPLLAGPVSHGYLTRKWFERNRPYVIVAIIAAAATLLGAIAVNIQALPVQVVSALVAAALVVPILVMTWLQRVRADALVAEAKKIREQADMKLIQQQRRVSDGARRLSLAVRNIDEIIRGVVDVAQLPAARDSVGRMASATLECFDQLFEETGAELADLESFRSCLPRLARVCASAGNVPAAIAAARRALAVLNAALVNSRADTTIRFELSGLLELMADLYEQSADRPAAERHLREAILVNEEIRQDTRFETGPLCNLLRLHAKLKSLSPTHSMDEAARAAQELKQLADRGAKLPEETVGLMKPLLPAAPAPAADS